MFAPEWESAGRRRSVQSIGFYGCHKQGRIGGNVESRLAFHRGVIPHLCLSNSQQVFLVFLIDLDLPAIKISLQRLRNGHIRIIDEQIGRFTIECVSVSAIAQRSDDDQAQGACGRGTAPKDWGDRLVVQLVLLARRKDGAFFPGRGRILPQLFGRWEQGSIRHFSTFAGLVLAWHPA